MELNDAKILIEIGLLATGSSGVLLWWKKVTNKREVEVYKEKNALLKIQLNAEKERADLAEKEIARVSNVIEATETAVRNDPKLAKAIFDHLTSINKEWSKK